MYQGKGHPPHKLKNARLGIFLFIWSGQMRTGEAMFDKIAGENEQGEVQAVAIWKGTHERSEVGIYNLATTFLLKTRNIMVSIK